MYILLENTVRRGPTLRAVNIEQWVQVSDSLLQNSPPTFLLMISVVTDNHCLHLLFHCLLEIGNFLSIVYEICSIAPFSILFLKSKLTTFSTREVRQSLCGMCVRVGCVEYIILPKVTI